MSNPDSFELLMRGLIIVSHCVPIKVMCLGLYPYEQDILPPIATSLLYCPSKCSGATPSVQVLSQSMANFMARKMDHRTKRRRLKGMNTDWDTPD